MKEEDKKNSEIEEMNSQNKNFEITKSGSGSFLQYLKTIQQFPILTPEEEAEYGKKYVEQKDKEAAKMLIQSHLRLVVKMAGKFKNYGLPIVDLVSEGNLGLIQALKKFDPRKGFRFSTYAMWWIRAYIQDYILRSWSLVKIGTTLAQKKLFFNLNKIKKRIGAFSDDKSALNQEQIKQIAQDLNVSQEEVISMDSRLSQSDGSLNSPINDDESAEYGDFIASNEPSQEEIVINNQEKSRQAELFKKAFSLLNDREKDILLKRQMTENPMTLEDLSQIYKISRERVRQIEENAIKKIKKEIQNQ